MTPTGYRHPDSDEARLDRLEHLLDTLVADLAHGIDPKKIAKRHHERAQLEAELDRLHP